ncbi:lipocalin family protein [Heyndrickxia sp. MSNUG]|uniref:lipocalin family protein n=1 Tax=Heyndrickxia sp. MSNUG TaxID=3136677 RepID=UPI003C2D38D5
MNDERLDVISLPKDVRPHNESNIEWWYFFAHLKGDMGGRYAVMTSFFRVGELEIGKGHYIIHTLIDLNRKKRFNFSGIDWKLKMGMLAIYLPFHLLRHPTDYRMWRLYKCLLKGDIPSPHAFIKNTSIIENPTVLNYGTNKLTFKGENEEAFDVFLKERDSEVQLEFTPLKPVGLIGGDGKPDDLYYYSFTRNKVKGRIKTDNGTETVKGQGWFDHQWGRDYSLAKGSGWNWFGVQLSDGRDLLLNEMTSGKPDSSMANIVEKDGTIRFTRDITFKKIKYWKSLKTNGRYPVEWQISIPEFAIELHVEAVFPNQEMPILGPIKGIWEGACRAEGIEILPSGKRKGLEGIGFMELVGYA